MAFTRINGISNLSYPMNALPLRADFIETPADTAASALVVRAFDVDGATYVTFITLTANNTPTCDLSDSVTKAGGYIYRAGGTDVPVADGGTGVSSLTSNGLLYGGTTVGALSAATNGQLPIGNTGNPPTLATLSAGAGISISNGAGTITISGSGGGFTWTEVTGTSANLAVNNGYIANNAGLVTLTLPTTAALGDTIKILGKGAGLWKLAQNASQFVNIVNTSTTTGATGSLTATEQYDCLTVICTTANNGWVAAEIVGNLTTA
jgi:hypothetical protein